MSPAEPVHGWDRLVAWANRRGVSVVLSDQSVWCPDEQTIRISRHTRGAGRVFDLAHECGHVLRGHRWDVRWAHNRVREECEAWEAGRVLLRRLRVPLDYQVWERHVQRRLRTYLRWAAKQRSPRK